MSIFFHHSMVARLTNNLYTSNCLNALLSTLNYTYADNLAISLAKM